MCLDFPINLGLARPFNSDCLENASPVNLESFGRANFWIAARTLTVLSTLPHTFGVISSAAANATVETDLGHCLRIWRSGEES